MISIKENKIVIEINHPSPEEFHKDLKESIIGAIQYQTHDSGDQEKIHFVNFTLLELLKNLDNSFNQTP